MLSSKHLIQQHIHIGDEAFFAEDDEEEEESEEEAKEASSITGENLRTNQFLTQEEKTPKFIIIGATKCSTSALLRTVLTLNSKQALISVTVCSKPRRFLQFHPLLRSAASELYFFNRHYDEGVGWYYKQFEHVAVHNRNLTLFEKTPTYYTNPVVPERIKKDFPNVKLIISGV